MYRLLLHIGSYSLLAIFLSYYASITFFMHAHIINGVTVVHSHPYKTNSDGIPDHEHKASEIQLISHLSQFAASDDLQTELLPVDYPIHLSHPEQLPALLYLQAEETAISLRAPPAA